jgi:hypothetical protein
LSVLSVVNCQVELITRPEESRRLLCVLVCDPETSRMRKPWHTLGRRVIGEKKVFLVDSMGLQWHSD